MNDHKNDKQIKEKMQSLNTLSGGIVFGKEDAWERLQARMEQKPVKRIPVKYWMSAAAMLLLFVCVTTVYYYPSREVAKSSNEKINRPINSIAVTQQQIVSVEQQQEMLLQKITTPAVQGAPIKASLNNKKEEQAEVINVPVAQTPIKENKTVRDETVANIPNPVAIQKPMKTVHINELDDEDKVQQTNTVAVNTSSKIDLRNLPVVHINDITDNRWEEPFFIKKESFAVNIPFLKPFNDHTAADAQQNENYIPRNSLKFKIN